MLVRVYKESNMSRHLSNPSYQMSLCKSNNEVLLLLSYET